MAEKKEDEKTPEPDPASEEWAERQRVIRGEAEEAQPEETEDKTK